jgi:hypothetical protein
MVGSVKCNADEKRCDGKHEDANKNVHLYSFPVSSIRRWIWRWSIKIPKPSKTAVAMARASNLVGALSTAEASHPTRLISATTTIPSHNLR